MRKNLLAFAAALVVAFLGAASPPPSMASDVEERASCVAASERPPNVRLDSGEGADSYDFAWMADPDHFGGPNPYIVHVTDRASPRSLIQHDRVILPGGPGDWIAAPHSADLVLCYRRAAAVIVIKRQFCSGPVAVADVSNGEIEEITFLGGITWLADDIHGLIDERSPSAEVAEDLRSELAAAIPASRDLHTPDWHSTVYRPEIDRLVSAWKFVPMSQALGEHIVAAPGCYQRHADLRDRISPTNRSNR